MDNRYFGAGGKHYFARIVEAMVQNWDKDALSDIGGVNYKYRDVAVNVAKLQLSFEKIGIRRGDKIVICGKNCANWGISYLASTFYGAVVVCILPDFSITNIHELINHSDARVLIVSNAINEGIDTKAIPNIDIVISMQDFSVVFSKEEFGEIDVERLYINRYPDGIAPSDIRYPMDNWDELALINYTSGSSGNPKGVMLTHRNLSSNVSFGQDHIPTKPTYNVVSMLPLAHMFGLMFEFLYQLAGGTHIYFVTRTPTPTILMDAFERVHPYMVLTVPLVIEKIIRGKVFPVIRRPHIKILWYLPIIGHILRHKVKRRLLEAFGGKLLYLIIGGAALNRHVEKCLRQIHFPYTCGYGMTECGPLICYEDYKLFVRRSCGKIVDRMQIKIDSDQPHRNVGEILVRGDNVMRGYYKNTKLTDSIFTDDGWMRTGDVGIIDKQGNLFIKGRSKAIILGANGQNIYPEEIEDLINSIDGIEESLVVGRGGILVALVYPTDKSILTSEEKMNAFAQETLDNIRKLNKVIPSYIKIAKIEVMKEEFQKTPKRSIKRFLYK